LKTQNRRKPRWAIRLALRFWSRDARERFGEELAARFDQDPSFQELINVIGEGLAMRRETIWLNLILSLRSLRRSWLAGLIAVAAVAFGVGANVAGAALVSAALLHPLPVPNPQQVYFVNAPDGISYSDGHSLAGSISLYGSMALSEVDHRAFIRAGRTTILTGALVDPTYFSVLRIRPILGSFFDASSTATIVLSEKFWRTNYGSASIVGNTIKLDDRTYVVAGVAPAGFSGFPQYDTNAAYWLPLVRTQPRLATDRSFTAVIRTKDGLDPISASKGIREVLETIQHHDKKNAPCCLTVSSAQSSSLIGLRPLILVVYFFTWIILIIGCINVANLQLARNFSASTQRATRAAIGATPSQINSEIVTDVALVSAAGCIFGLIIAWGILQMGASWLPVLSDVSINASVVGYTLALILMTTTVIAIVPCVAQARLNIALGLRGTGQSSAGPRGRRFITGLVLVQVGLTAMLGISSSAVIKSFNEMQNASTGIATHNTYVASIERSDQRYALMTEDDRAAYFRRWSNSIVRNLKETPGIINAATTSQVPFFCCILRKFSILGGASNVKVLYASVTPDYFAALGIHLELGRLFEDDDTETSQPVAIVDTLFAQQYYGTRNVLGQEIAGASNYRIVGVVSSARQEFGVPPKPMVYLAMTQFPIFSEGVVVRTDGNVHDVARILDASIHLADADLPTPDVYSFDEVIHMRETPSIIGTWTIFVFAIVALALALSGVYAISSFSSQLRRHEFAIRAALGATRGNLLLLAVSRPIIQAVIALLIGAALSNAVTGMLSAALSIDIRSNALSIVVAVGLLVMCVFLATVIPAFGALRMSPAKILRSD
jgi:predicted permease